MKFELSQEQLNNLKVLLSRVNLSGAEVPGYVDLVNTLNNPLKEEPEEEVKK